MSLMHYTGIITFCLEGIQRVVSWIIGTKNYYLDAPEHILSDTKVHNITIMGHFFPTVISTILIAIKLFPMMFDSYAKALEKNATIIPVTVICTLIPIAVLNGVIIEKRLMRKYEKYKEYTQDDL